MRPLILKSFLQNATFNEGLRDSKGRFGGPLPYFDRTTKLDRFTGFRGAELLQLIISAQCIDQRVCQISSLKCSPNCSPEMPIWTTPKELREGMMEVGACLGVVPTRPQRGPAADSVGSTSPAGVPTMRTAHISWPDLNHTTNAPSIALGRGGRYACSHTNTGTMQA